MTPTRLKAEEKEYERRGRAERSILYGIYPDALRRVRIFRPVRSDCDFREKVKVKWNKVIFFGLLALSVCATALFAVRFSRYCLDFGTVRKGEYRTMTGTVTGYGKAVSFENGSVGFYVPRIRDAETGEIMELHVSGTETGIPFSICRIQNLP